MLMFGHVWVIVVFVSVPPHCVSHITSILGQLAETHRTRSSMCRIVLTMLKTFHVCLFPMESRILTMLIQLINWNEYICSDIWLCVREFVWSGPFITWRRSIDLILIRFELRRPSDVGTMNNHIYRWLNGMELMDLPENIWFESSRLHSSWSSKYHFSNSLFYFISRFRWVRKSSILFQE